MFVAGMAVWLCSEMSRGDMVNADELRTAERSREMLLRGRSTVFFNFKPSFAKPPLQYWLTSLTLSRFSNPAAGVRIWSITYAVLTVCALALLAFTVGPGEAWLVPISVALAVSCPFISAESVRGYLDMGLAFFTTAAIVCSQLARKEPRWWLGVAVACWLSALQKVPLVLLIWLIVVTVRYFDPLELRTLKTKWLPLSFLLAFALVAIWPVFQFVYYHMPLARAFTGDDLPVLLGPKRLGANLVFEVVTRFLGTGWIGGPFAVIAAIGLLSLRYGRNARPVREIAIIALTLTILALVFGFRSVRYLIPVIPAFCLVLAFAILFLGRKWRWAAILFPTALVIGGVIQSQTKIRSRQQNATAETRMAEELGRQQNENATILLIKSSNQNDRELLYTHFYLFYGNLRYPVERQTLSQVQQSPPHLPATGVCLARDFPIIRGLLPEAKVVRREGKFVCWVAQQ
jgi:4-amino-4-deoxy-L-arabinose transferase-like glycosyltransferase